MEILAIIVVYLILCSLLAYQGKAKKLGLLSSFILSFFLTPLIGVFFVMFSPKKFDKRERVKPKSKKKKKNLSDDDL